MFEQEKIYERFIIFSCSHDDGDELERSFATLQEAIRWVSDTQTDYFTYEIFDCTERRIVYY